MVAACGAGPRVSPWGEEGRPRLADYAVRPDLAAHVATIEDEAARLGLVEDGRVEAKDARSGDPLVAVSLVGRDAIGRAVHAVRVASPWGVVLARGPLDLRDVRRREATVLRREPEDPLDLAIGDPLPTSPLADLLGDGAAHVVLRGERGQLEVWKVTSRASTQVAVVMDVEPTAARDVDGDGRFDLVGRVPPRDGDPIAPAFIDVATWTGASLTHRSPVARSWHAAQRDRARARRAAATADVARLREALQAAWHAVLAGDDQARALEALDRERPSPALRDAWADHGRRIARIGR